jgi:hypothetical protein
MGAAELVPHPEPHELEWRAPLVQYEFLEWREPSRARARVSDEAREDMRSARRLEARAGEQARAHQLGMPMISQPIPPSRRSSSDAEAAASLMRAAVAPPCECSAVPTIVRQQLPEGAGVDEKL